MLRLLEAIAAGPDRAIQELTASVSPARLATHRAVAEVSA
jgi:hypothetical protein